jgi:hypothetical protein
LRKSKIFLKKRALRLIFIGPILGMIERAEKNITLANIEKNN